MRNIRLNALAKKSRRNLGTKKSGDALKIMAKTLKELRSQIKTLENEANSIQKLMVMATTPLAKLIIPLNPPEGYETVAVFDLDEVGVYYENEEGDIIEVPWPFDTQFIYPDYCKELGIRVE
jgi:hypothetical protein